MDAHLFSLFCQASLPLLEGAIFDKIQDINENTLSFALHFRTMASANLVNFAVPKASKAWLILHYEKKQPYLFLSWHKPPAQEKPSAFSMRLRKILNRQMILTAIPDLLERRLYLLLPQMAKELAQPKSSKNTKKYLAKREEVTEQTNNLEPSNLWLELDLVNGVKLTTLADLPTISPINWPDKENLATACTHWQEWPILTPALRRTLKWLDLAEQASLLNDLALGGGDIFTYQQLNPKTKETNYLISPWPLPEQCLPKSQDSLSDNKADNKDTADHKADPKEAKESKNAWTMTISEDILPCFEQYGNHRLYAEIKKANLSLSQNPSQRQKRKLEKLLVKLQDEQARLEELATKQDLAKLLQANLWRWQHNQKDISFVLVERADSIEKIAIPYDLTICEYMQKLFSLAQKGKRGLEHLKRRKQEISQELATLESINAEAELLSSADVNKQVVTSSGNILIFISSDGFKLLRGKNNKGNLEVLRLASPHDLWLHVADGPGAHVIIRKNNPKQIVPERTLDEAGILAANKSWLKDATKARILCAYARHIQPMRKAKGKVNIGQIQATREVIPDPNLENQLQAK